ncbi:MAG: BspA family leucine-rich repeat surface protein [Bacteroidaceae bacterium]|nr:BspA family leucine-rich repeat surface protein [Bacteroidaceae bacterium]
MKRFLSPTIKPLLVFLMAILSGVQSVQAQTKEAYAYSPTSDRTTFYFYYDTSRATRNTTGVTFNLNTGANTPEWYNYHPAGAMAYLQELVKTVVFDASFSDYRPTSTASWFRMPYLETIENFYYLYTQNVTCMNYMFNGCQRLATLDFRNLSGSTTNMTDNYCFNTENVTSMRGMFGYCRALTSLDLSGWNTSNVTDMAGMFEACYNLQTLTLGKGSAGSSSLVERKGWNTSKVTDMNVMFGTCTNLTTINVGANWSTVMVNTSCKPFTGSTKLVGGAGTTYSDSYNSPTYARIDGGTSTTRGLLTATYGPYVHVNSAGTTVTFYYDELRSLRSGTTYNLNTSSSSPGWYKSSDNNPYTRVVIDPSFAQARPTTCYGWFSGMKNVTTIEGLEYLNTSEVTNMKYMFSNCFSLTSLDLSHFNTSKVTDMYGMFEQCKALTELDLSQFSTSKVKNMQNMFISCQKLTTIYASSNFSVSNVSFSQNMFIYCYKLVGGAGTEYSISYVDKGYARIDGGTASPGYFSTRPYAVYNNGTLTFYDDGNPNGKTGTKYNLNSSGDPGWLTDNNYQNVTKVVFNSSFANARPKTTMYWFGLMTNLTSITGLEYLNTSEVTSMSNMFSHTKLASLDLSHFNTQKVVTMGSMFYNCKQLTSLDLSSFNTANVIEMSAMFSSCNNLQRIYVGDGWSTAKVGSHELMFQTCTSLVGGNGTAFNSSYTDKTYARIDGFNGLPGYLTRPAYAVLNDGTLTFYCDGQKSSRTGTIYDIPTAKEEAPGWYGSSITHVVFSSSFAQARPTTGYAWFRGQTGLTDITGIQYLNTSEMTSMKYMFNRCSSLTSLNLHTFNTSKVTDMMLMFYKCSKLKTLNLEGWNTSNVTMMVSMFQDCSALTTIICEQTWKASTNSTYMFLGCGKLKGAVSYLDVLSDPLASTAAYANPTSGYFSLRPYAVHYPNTNSLYFYNDGRASYKTGTVYYLDALGDDYYPLWYINDGASVSHSVTNVNFDASFATARPTSTKGWFSEMTNITTINNIERLNTENVENMEAMFEGCTGLTTLNLATFKTANVKNMNSMFHGCSNLTTINVSANWTTDNVTSSTNMFTGCSAIVGGNGTAYSGSHVDKEYARLDAEGTPGYFSGELPYLILSPDETTLTFYNDGLSAEKEGTRYNFTNAYGDTPSWRPKAGGVTKVVFDPSFATVRPQWVNSWFMNMTNLTTIEGMEYFNFSQTRRFNSLFSNCSSLTEIDLSHFTPGTGCAMGGMFYGCTNLMTIVVASDWTLNIVSNGDNMFSGCTSLVGGKGTTFDANNIGRTYARIDGGPSNPGYLTSGAREYYATWDAATSTITHYYDWRKSQRIAAGEEVIDGQGYDEMPSGNGDVYPGEIAKVVYDESCALSDGFYDTWSCVGMENLTAIEGLEHLGTSGNISLDNMFADCRSLTTLDLSSFDTHNETRTRNLFRGCTNLQNLTLGENFSTESVTDMSGMFSYNCNPSAIAAVISHEGFTTANVTNMKGMFQNCTSLITLDLSAFDTRNVTNMGEVHNTFSEGMFEGCSNLTTIIVGPDWSTAAVTTSAQMFRNCTALVGGEGTVFSTSHVDAAYAHIDRGAYNPGYLTGKAYAPYVIYDDVSRVLTFYADNKEDEKDGTKYDLPAAQTTPGWNEGGQNMFVTKVVFDPSFITARPTSTWSWFMNMSNLTKIEGLENLVTSEVTDMTAMFGGCTGLTTLDLTSFNTAKVTNMSYMFNGCSALQTIYVGAGWTTTNVTSGAEMFNGCTSLVGSAGTVYDSSNRGIAYAHVDGGESNPGYLSGKTEGYAAYDSDTKTLTFYYDGQKLARSNVYDLNEGTNAPKWVANSSTSPLTNARRAVIDPSFADARPTSTCGWFNLYYLQEIEGMEYLNTSEVTVMNAMFARCAVSDLDLSHFDTRKVTSMYSMFWGAHGLTTLDLSSFDTKNVVDMRRMFAGYDATHTNILTTIYVGSDWNTDAVVVSTNMFANSPNLVGGNGTAYDPEHVDKAYARLDGGTSSPGYLSDKNAFSVGDVNKDRKITIADVTALVNIILGKTTDYESRLADVNTDGNVTIADVTALVNIILGK